MAKRSQAAPQVVRTETARTKVMALRIQGLTFERIGLELGISTQRAQQLVQEELDALREQSQELALALRDQRLTELQQLAKVFFPKAHGGDLKSLEGLLKIMDREARLMGLDSPAKTEKTVNTKGPLEGLPREELIEEARRRGIPVVDNVRAHANDQPPAPDDTLM